MVMDLHEKGAIRANAPILQTAKADVRARTERNVENRFRVKDPEKGKRIQNEATIKERSVKEERNTKRVQPKRSKDIDQPVKSRYNVKDDDVYKGSGKTSKGHVKEYKVKESKRVKSESGGSKSSIKKSEKKSSGSSYKKSEKKSSSPSYKKSVKKSSSQSKSSSDKAKRSTKSSKSSIKSSSARGKRR
jgi:hypothetical protein